MLWSVRCNGWVLHSRSSKKTHPDCFGCCISIQELFRFCDERGCFVTCASWYLDSHLTMIHFLHFALASLCSCCIPCRPCWLTCSLCFHPSLPQYITVHQRSVTPSPSDFSVPKIYSLRCSHVSIGGPARLLILDPTPSRLLQMSLWKFCPLKQLDYYFPDSKAAKLSSVA